MSDQHGAKAREAWLRTLSGTLTDDDLAAIEKAEQAASPAPWVLAITPKEWGKVEIAENQVQMVNSGGDRAHFCIHPDDVDDDAPRVTAFCGNGPTSEANARFLEVARCAVPMLVQEVRALRAENEALKGEVERLRKNRDDYKDLMFESDERAERRLQQRTAAEAKRDEWFRAYDKAMGEKAAAEAALESLRGEVREVLTKVEWQGDITEAAGKPGCCPACIMDYAVGHYPDCRLAALLKRVGP